ncbi:hypothetical protein CRE_24753 [Caenorhabditis remanei]|uniref:Uncharacterized protein n=1 Tax=Caenorhabditis remanei TaxID=31234 RepID=E3N956_CAERE|nr:hypothetical protein CRE_24753 [Caenorhabditis remanei]
MNISLVSILVLLSIFIGTVHSQPASLTFGDNTRNSPRVNLKATNQGNILVQTVTWSFQPSRCELLTRVDETIHERVKFVSKTSVCTHQDLCSHSTFVTTGITCDEFMKVLN